MIGETQIKEAFWNAVTDAGYSLEDLRRGVNLVFQFNDQLYEVGTGTYQDEHDDIVATLENRACKAVLYKQHPSGDKMKELYKKQQSDKQEESQWSRQDKLFFASCRAMQGILSGIMSNKEMFDEAELIKAKEGKREVSDWVVERSIKTANKLLNELNKND